MGLLPWVWYGGRAGVAVLYSVVVGAVREFWVKTAAVDVKVHEIPLTSPYVPTTSIGGVGAVATFSGSYSGTAFRNVTRELTAALPIGGQFLYQMTYTLTWTGPTSGPSSEVQWGSGVLPGSETGLGWNSTFGLTPSASGTSVFRGLNAGQFISSVGCAFATDFIVGFDSSGTAGTPSATYSINVSIIQYDGPTTFAVPYESWISPAPGGAYVIVKHSEELFFGCGDDGLVNDFEFTKLLLTNGAGTGTLYENGDDVVTRLDNWRVESEDFLIVADQPPTGNICIDNALDSITSAFAGGNLYAIALDQIISGQSLRDRLQTSPDTVTATLTTQTATSGDTCTLGTAAETPVQVPSSGRGTVEGITYLP